MTVFVNVSTYLFAPLTGLKELRLKLLGQCRGLGLKGTILLSSEGIKKCPDLAEEGLPES
jgi:predicted sulfurtransferase